MSGDRVVIDSKWWNLLSAVAACVAASTLRATGMTGNAQNTFFAGLRGLRAFFTTFAFVAFAVVAFVVALILPARFLTRVVIFCTCAVGAAVPRFAALTFLRAERFALPATALALLAAVWAVRASCMAAAFAALASRAMDFFAFASAFLARTFSFSALFRTDTSTLRAFRPTLRFVLVTPRLASSATAVPTRCAFSLTDSMTEPIFDIRVRRMTMVVLPAG